MKRNKSIKASTYISILIFLALIGSSVFTLLVGAILIKSNILMVKNPLNGLILFSIFNIIMVSTIHHLFTRNLMQIIYEITQASEEIANGNYDVRLAEDYIIEEFQRVATSFNIMEKQLSQTELFRNDFIRNISHEFKTPLSAIEGYSQLLQTNTLSTEKRELYTQKIIFNTKRLSGLITAILDLSQLENREILVQKEKFLLDEQLREVLLFLEPQWKEKEIELDIDMGSVEIFGKHDLLAQVWQNLISNAIKFSYQKGKLYVGLKRSQKQIIVTVTDYGMGIAPENIERIFEKFYQEDTIRSSEGNGLGLALVKRIIDLHAGHIDVYSKPKKGTTFIISLPNSASTNE